MVSAIRSLDIDAFPAAFARIVGSDFRADQVVVFRFDESGRIRTLLAQNMIEGTARAQHLA